jgi:23S rRNA (cytidine1920-2'-O)/16S rRNA (cytidine1409-2'-O)-methyltransferase
MAGLVEVDGRLEDKSGTQVSQTVALSVKERPRFVSRAGDKLAHALSVLAVDPSGAAALDVGASTGGFTDCLLQEGAARVIALDVGYGQLDARLRADERVFVLERVNARHLSCEQLPFAPNLVTADVSFISLHKVLPAVVACAADSFRALVLVKPQFEAGPERVGRGGIVRDPEVHRSVLLELGRFVVEDLRLPVWGVTDSGLPGAGGNREFFLLFGRGGEAGLTPATLERAVDRLLAKGDQDE